MTKGNNPKPRQQLGEIFFPKPPAPPVENPQVAVSQNLISVLDCRWRTDGPLGDVVECRVIMGPSQFAPGQPGQAAQGGVRFVANRPGAWHLATAPFPQTTLNASSPFLTSQAHLTPQQAFSLLWKPSGPGRPQGLEFEIHAERREGQKITHYASWTGPDRWPASVRLAPAQGRTLLLMRPNNG